MRITLNLATRPFTDAGPAIKRLRQAMGAMALLSLLLGVGLYALHQKAEAARAREHSLDAKIAGITRERQGYQQMMQLPENAAVVAHAEVLNQLFDEKAFSWTLAMEDLETVLPGGVQVTTLEPVRDKDGHITLHLRVIGPRDKAVDLVKNLEHSRHFLLPRIVGESAESTGAPGEQLVPVSASNRVNFDLLADYNPATATEVAKPAGKSEKASADTGDEPVPAAKHVKPAALHAALPRPAQAFPTPVSRPQHTGRLPYSGVSVPPPVPQPKPRAGGAK